MRRFPFRWGDGKSSNGGVNLVRGQKKWKKILWLLQLYPGLQPRCRNIETQQRHLLKFYKYRYARLTYHLLLLIYVWGENSPPASAVGTSNLLRRRRFFATRTNCPHKPKYVALQTVRINMRCRHPTKGYSPRDVSHLPKAGPAGREKWSAGRGFPDFSLAQSHVISSMTIEGGLSDSYNWFEHRR